jgi:hypothetical protein
VISRESQRRTSRDLSIDAHALANELRALVQSMPARTFGRNEVILEDFRRRYATRARDLGLRLRERNLVTTHFLYRLVSVGPQMRSRFGRSQMDLIRLSNLTEPRDQYFFAIRRDLANRRPPKPAFECCPRG